MPEEQLGSRIMNIAIIGIGGVGGFFGGKLSQILDVNKDLKLYFIARGEHLDKIKRNGLILDSDEGKYFCRPTDAFEDISQLPELDLCLVCVKSYDLQSVIEQLKSKISQNTIILPLLNGVDIYERIRSITSKGILLPSCVYVGTHIEEPGVVKQRGGSRTIHFEKDPQNNYFEENILKKLDEAMIKYNFTDEPYSEIWSKFIFIASYGLVTSAFDKTLGEILESEEYSGYVKTIMGEVKKLADSKNISLSEKIIEESFSKGFKFSHETKTSFQRDYENKDKMDERDLFGGTIIRLGEELSIEIPVTRKIYDIIVS